LIENLADITFDHTEVVQDGLTVPELNLNVHGFRDVVSAEEGVVLSFSDGTPAFIEKKIGRGKVVYAAFSLFLSLNKNLTPKAAEFLRKHLPSPPIMLEGSKDLEAIYWEDSTPLIYIINHGHKKADAILSVPQKFTKAEELLRKQNLEATEGKLELSFEGREIKVIHLLT